MVGEGASQHFLDTIPIPMDLVVVGQLLYKAAGVSQTPGRGGKAMLTETECQSGREYDYHHADQYYQAEGQAKTYPESVHNVSNPLHPYNRQTGNSPAVGDSYDV
jgi:hypothetical protein